MQAYFNVRPSVKIKAGGGFNLDTVWSKNIFGIETLKTIRDFRFHKSFAEKYLEYLPIRPGMRLVDLGCGPGSFTRCVYGWFDGDLRIFGLDFDDGYIDYCKKAAAKENCDISYFVGDVRKTAFPDGYFDVTTSYTVAQHVENTSFFKEQKRILKKGGFLVLMNAGAYGENIGHQLELIPQSQQEAVMQKALEAYVQNNPIKTIDARFNKYKAEAGETIKLLGSLGFENISLHKVKVFGSPDNPQPDEFSRLIIDNFYCSRIDFANSVLNNYSEEVIRYIAKQYIGLVTERRAKRLEMYEKHIKIGDSVFADTEIIIAQKL